MPILKSPCQFKMANGSMNRSNGKLILEKMNISINPFESNTEENERDSFLGDCQTPSPGSRNPFEEEESNDFNGDLLNSSFRSNTSSRRGTLEKLVGLSPFKMGKVKKEATKEKQQNGEKGLERRSFLGHMMMPLTKGDQFLKVPERKKPRRSSEDFSILQMFNGKRKESLTNQDLSPQEGGNGGDAMKRLLKLGRGVRPRRESMVDKVLLPESTEAIPVLEEAKRVEKQPLSVLEIFSLIQNRQLETADEYIIDLEAECDWGSCEGAEGSKDCSRKARDVVLLYEALMKELWDMVAESLTVKSIYSPLESLIHVINQEEAMDRKWLEGRGDTAKPDTSGRPREMKKRWAEAVKKSADKRLCQCLDSKCGSIPAQVEKLKKCAVEDLYTVKNHLVCVYPKEFQVFRVYMRSYHEGIASWLGQIVQGELDISDLYFVLDWNCNAYSREVLGRAEIASLVHAEELGPLLPPETQCYLEEACISAVKEKIKPGMTQELQAEGERWAREVKLEEYQSVLPSKVISLLKTHVDRAPAITQEFGARIGHCCLCALADFLQSFQKKVQGFHKRQAENRLPAEAYIAKTIAIGNCCPPFREYAARLAQLDQAESEEVGQRAAAMLDRVTNLCNGVLTELIFDDLKPYFGKLMKKKWLNSSEAFESIVETLTDYSEKLRQMSSQPYQALVRELHRQVLLEYVRPLLQAKMVCNSAKARGKMAAKLQHEAQQLQAFFQQLESDASWLDSVVPHIAEIIFHEDTPSVQMEVGVLVTEFPDIRKGHLAAILDVRGTWNQAVRQDILAVVEDLEGGSSHTQLSRDRAFFSEITITTEAHCLPMNLNHASRLFLTCVFRLQSEASSRSRIRAQQTKGEMDQIDSEV